MSHSIESYRKLPMLPDLSFSIASSMASSDTRNHSPFRFRHLRARRQFHAFQRTRHVPTNSACSIDYDVTAAATKRFFATVQNKLHWAIHGQTAAEVIVSRADANKDHMGLTTWKDAPRGKIQKFDVSVAKNYLTESEMAQLQRIVSAYLDLAEAMALREIPMTMQDWEIRLNRFIAATDLEILQDAGKVTAEIAHAHAESEFEKYRIVQDRLFVSDFDRLLTKLPEPPEKGDKP